MYTFIFLLIIFLIILLILLSVFHLKVIFAFNSQQYTNFKFMISWLYPIFKAIITKEGNSNIVSIYLFNKMLFTKSLKPKKRGRKFNFNFLKAIKFDYVKVRTSYGFRDPAITGWLYAIITLISTYVEAKDVYNNPDFSMNTSYMNLNAETSVNLISTLINFFKLKASN